MQTSRPSDKDSRQSIPDESGEQRHHQHHGSAPVAGHLAESAAGQRSAGAAAAEFAWLNIRQNAGEHDNHQVAASLSDFKTIEGEAPKVGAQVTSSDPTQASSISAPETYTWRSRGRSAHSSPSAAGELLEQQRHQDHNSKRHHHHHFHHRDRLLGITIQQPPVTRLLDEPPDPIVMADHKDDVIANKVTKYILSCIILVTFVGNVLVCLSVIRVRKLRHPSNYLLISLAISDLCVACVVMPFGLYNTLNDKWQLGRFLCNAYVVSDVTSCTASILNLCVISIDRYLAITRPLTYCVKRTTRLMLILIAIVWFLACLISVPPLVIFGNEHGTSDTPRCEVSQSLWYQLYATCISFYIPLIVMICLYFNIYTAAKRVIEAERRATTALNGANAASQTNSKSISYLQANNQLTQNNLIQPSRASNAMKERKASITLGVIMSAFTICWLPFFIIALLRPFSDKVNHLPRIWQEVTLWLGYANSLLNPIIYVTFHHDFRNAFKHLLCLRCMTINEHIRKDEYKSQFGENNHRQDQVIPHDEVLRSQPKREQQVLFQQPKLQQQQQQQEPPKQRQPQNLQPQQQQLQLSIKKSHSLPT